ncbi:MAG TPA: magnesium/cobalt transporter CorA [Gemmatimonadales bacterium]|nr:magnesium/cobalt transporter CorA [Gemmatimonadales bacterium]
MTTGLGSTIAGVDQDSNPSGPTQGVLPRTAPSRSSCYVTHEDHVGEMSLTRDSAEGLLASGTFFWIDLHEPTEGDFSVLRDVFHFHPLAIEDSEHFGQRSKLDDYDDFVFLVVYGAVADEDRLVEVHAFYSERYLVTVRRDDAPAFTLVRERYVKRNQPIEDPSLLLYRIIDALVDSFFPILSEFDDRIDELENRIFLNAGDEQLQEIFSMKRLLVGMRKAVAPERDMFASLLTGVAELPGLTRDDQRYFRDIYDHLIRISDLIDTYRDLLTSSMDVFLSTVSNRLNVVMKQLAVIATIFLPLAFITGFFGQNFGWMVRNIGGLPAFLSLGIGTELVVVVLLLLMFRRRGWL